MITNDEYEKLVKKYYQEEMDNMLTNTDRIIQKICCERAIQRALAEKENLIFIKIFDIMNIQ